MNKLFKIHDLVINFIIWHSILELLNNLIWIIIVAITDLDWIIKYLSSSFYISLDNMSSKVIDGSAKLSSSLLRGNFSLYIN